MNIIFIALDFKPATGGIGEYTHQLAKQLHLLGETVTVVAQDMPGAEPFDSACPYNVIRFDFLKLRKKGWQGYYQRYKFLRSTIKSCQADIIFSNALQSEAFFCWLLACQRRVPFCIFAYGREVNRPRHSKNRLIAFRHNLTALRALRRASHVFCISHYTEQLVHELGVSPKNTSLLTPGIDTKDFDTEINTDQFKYEMGWQDKQIILSLCRLVERKGVDSVIRCLPPVLKQVPDLVYVVAGDGPYRAVLEKLVQTNQLDEHVVFTGYVPNEQKDLYYQVADIFVMPNRQLTDGDVEGFGIVFLEANIHAKPVVGGASGGTIDAILHGKTGLLVNPYDLDELASALIRLLKDKPYAKSVGEEGKKHVLAERTWSHVAVKLQSQLVNLST
jgi:phosphatidylinositol alpha-1,6-mannosyltransferase